MFIKLTKADGRKVRVNVSQIEYYIVNQYESYELHEKLTDVIFNKGLLSVKETPEQIDQMLRESYISIKETIYEPTRTSSPSREEIKSAISDSQSKE